MSHLSYPAFGTLLKYFRERAGISQEKLAEAVGKGVNTLKQQWEKNGRPATSAPVLDLARVLKLNEACTDLLLETANYAEQHATETAVLIALAESLCQEVENPDALRQWITTYAAKSRLSQSSLPPNPLPDNIPIQNSSFSDPSLTFVGSSGITVAQYQLVAMPLDTIPNVAPLPTGARMPFNPNPLFVGRETDLQILAVILKGRGSVTISHEAIAAITGLGGMGKTQLASAFVHRYGQYFAGGIFWLSFADPGAVPAEVAACGGLYHMNLRPDFSTLSLGEQVGLVLAEWQSALPRLLVFDNCEDEKLLAEWRPRSGGCRVLITSRRASWDPTLGVRTLPIEGLPRPQSVELLCHHCPDRGADDAIFDAIAAELDDMPLTLHLAGKYLARYRYSMTPELYLQQLRSTMPLKHPSLQGGYLSPTGHQQHVERTFALSYEQLATTNPVDSLALSLLERAACFAPGEPIPRDILSATLMPKTEAALEDLEAEDALVRLVDELGLLEVGTDGALRLHRLLAVFVQAHMLDNRAQAAVEQTMIDLARQWNEAEDPRPLLALQRHLRAMTDVASKRIDEQAAQLCNEMGRHLRAIADYNGARHYYEQAIMIRTNMFGENSLETAESISRLGGVYLKEGGYSDAEDYYRRALVIQERVLGFDHVDTAQTLNDLGLVIRFQGKYVHAHEYYDRSLHIREKKKESHPFDFSESLHNLGCLFIALGDYQTAQLYLEHALKVRESIVGKEVERLANTLNHLGNAMRLQGFLTEAKSYLERALALREHVFGEDHPRTAQSLNMIGILLHDQKKYIEAQAIFERALDISERMSGEYHPDTVAILINFGALSLTKGRYEEARSYFERALEIREQRREAAHPETAIILDKIGRLMHVQGDFAMARRFYERALEIWEDEIPDHPDTTQCRTNLATLDK